MGIKTYTIGSDKVMSQKIADNTMILAAKNINKDFVMVTEEQFIVISQGSDEYSVMHVHNVHAAISRSYVITIDHQRKLSIYASKQNQSDDKNCLRNF